MPFENEQELTDIFQDASRGSAAQKAAGGNAATHTIDDVLDFADDLFRDNAFDVNVSGYCSNDMVVFIRPRPAPYSDEFENYSKGLKVSPAETPGLFKIKIEDLEYAQDATFETDIKGVMKQLGLLHGWYNRDSDPPGPQTYREVNGKRTTEKPTLDNVLSLMTDDLLHYRLDRYPIEKNGEQVTIKFPSGNVYSFEDNGNGRFTMKVNGNIEQAPLTFGRLRAVMVNKIYYTDEDHGPRAPAP